MTEMTPRRWFDYQGGIVQVPGDTPLTAWNWYDQRTHAIWPSGHGPLSQVLTKCGKRGCPASRNEIPGRGHVDCPACLEELRYEAEQARQFAERFAAEVFPDPPPFPIILGP